MEDQKKNPNLGKQGKDKVTGFTGTISAACEYSHSESTYRLEPPVKDGKTTDMWVSEGRLELVEDGTNAGPSE
jgi:hypothetical protein